MSVEQKFVARRPRLDALSGTKPTSTKLLDHGIIRVQMCYKLR